MSGPHVDYYDWSQDFLAALRIPPGASNLTAMVAWCLAEGGSNGNSADWNPLNTTLNTADVVRTINHDGVKAYSSYAAGLSANVRTISEPRYVAIVQALRTGTPQDVAQAVGSSRWGTKAGVYATIPVARGIVAKRKGSQHGSVIDVAGDAAGVILGTAADAGAFGIGPAVVGDPISAADAMAGLGKFALMLTKWDTWRRVLLFTGGAGLAVGGVAVIIRDNN